MYTYSGDYDSEVGLCTFTHEIIDGVVGRWRKVDAWW